MNYPQDMPLDGVMASMINKNVISPVIEKKKYLINGTNQQLLTTTHNDFTILPNDIVRPSDVKFSTGNNSLETRIQFNSYDIYGNVLEEQRSNDVKEVYLWGYNSIYPVARVTGSDYVTVNSVVNQSQIDAAVSNDASLRSVLNALRTDPRTNKALVTTYTYAPLIGMTSQTDPAGRTTYYEYDGLGRLKIVRDQNQNIVSKYCYNYAGQTTNCALQTFGNAPMSQSFTKNDCPGGATGSAVVYTVPANTYLSTISIADANARAQNDINANGQNYANANGSCSSSVSLNCNNYAGVLGFTIVFTSTTNGLQYSFPITPDGGVLGNVPADYYNVTISAPGNMTNYYFTVGSVSTYGVSATFYNVWIDNNNNTVTLDWLP
jgi:YD repeat-containing protein